MHREARKRDIKAPSHLLPNALNSLGPKDVSEIDIGKFRNPLFPMNKIIFNFSNGRILYDCYIF